MSGVKNDVEKSDFEFKKHVLKTFDKPKPATSNHEVIDLISDSDDECIEIKTPKENGKTSASSPKKPVSKEMDTSNEIEVVSESNSSDKDSCSICLSSSFTNRSFLNECFHAFCYYCVLQWSEISQTCPLCKKAFTMIIHDVKSITQYSETRIHKGEMQAIPPELRNRFRPTVRYRTTRRDDADRGTVPCEREDRDGVVELEQGAARPLRSHVTRKRRRVWGGKQAPVDPEFKQQRLNVYQNNLYAKLPVTEGNPKMRKATPEFYVEFEGAKHRLFPWIRNELEVLLYNDEEHVLLVMDFLWKLLDKHHIKSEEFKKEMAEFLHEKAEQFCHELYMFAVSQHDWKTYLRKVLYDEDASAPSRWDLSPVRYIGETQGSAEGDTISRTKWDDAEEPARTRSDSVEFIKEQDMEVSIESDSEEDSPKLLKVKITNDTDTPINIDDWESTPERNGCPTTPVYIDIDDIPPTPTPPSSPVSRRSSPLVSPIRTSPCRRANSPAGGSPVARNRRSSPMTGRISPSFPCSPIIGHINGNWTGSICEMDVTPKKRHNSPVEGQPVRSPSPRLRGKGKERKRKKVISSPVHVSDRSSPVKILTDDSEPCSSKYIT